MKILLFGANGMVGYELAHLLPRLGDVRAFNRSQADLEDEAAIRSIIVRERPDVVINAAAYTAVDQAEAEPEKARAINAIAPGWMAEELAHYGGWLVHYSTDYVFDGTKPEPYVETDPTNPLNVYGATKLEGEERIAASGCRHLIFRTSWVYAARGRNFLRTVLQLATERDELSIVSDQVGSPTSATLVAEVTAAALRQAQGRFPPPSGVYHACPAGSTSWHGYAQVVVSAAAARGVAVRSAADRIQAISAAEYPMATRRPANSRLDTAKLTATLNLVLPPWQDGVVDALEALLSGEAG